MPLFTNNQQYKQALDLDSLGIFAMLELFLAILELLTGLKNNNEGLNVEFEYL